MESLELALADPPPERRAHSLSVGITMPVIQKEEMRVSRQVYVTKTYQY